VPDSPAVKPHRASALAAALLLFMCAALAAPVAPREYLDEQTGATVTVVDRPLVFEYPRRDLAANAHDYATLAAAAVDRGGKVSYVLIVYFWSTVDPRLRGIAQPDAGSLVLQADDRRIALSLRGHSAREAGIGVAVHAPPVGNAAANVYGLDLATLRFLAASRHLALRADTDGATLTYELWEDRRDDLSGFVRHMSGAD